MFASKAELLTRQRRGDRRWYPIAKPNHVFTESDEPLAIHKFRLWEAEQKKGGPLSSDEAMQLNVRKLEAWQRWVETHPEATEQSPTDIEAAVAGEQLRIALPRASPWYAASIYVRARPGARRKTQARAVADG